MQQIRFLQKAYRTRQVVHPVTVSQQWHKPEAIFSTNANNMQNVFYIQNTCRKQLLKKVKLMGR